MASYGRNQRSIHESILFTWGMYRTARCSLFGWDQRDSLRAATNPVVIMAIVNCWDGHHRARKTERSTGSHLRHHVRWQFHTLRFTSLLYTPYQVTSCSLNSIAYHHDADQLYAHAGSCRWHPVIGKFKLLGAKKGQVSEVSVLRQVQRRRSLLSLASSCSELHLRPVSLESLLRLVRDCRCRRLSNILR
jgi:hypothetical protein